MNRIQPETPRPPLRYAHKDLRAVKEFVWGTHRAMPPEQTLARIRPHLGLAGITRVADITGLDTIGIPVATAMRPASGTLAVEGGKGISVAAAMTSAAMEGIERFVGEVDSSDQLCGTVADVRERLPVAADQFPMLRFAAIAATRQYWWTPMWDIVSDQEYLVPRDLVCMPTVEPATPFEAPWAAGSNGLASGNNLPEAVCAGLYEVIERDATTCWQVAHVRGAPKLIIDQSTIDGPAISKILATLDCAGVDATLIWCPTDVGVPTCMAYVVDRNHRVGIYKGYGCHLDPEIAMVRAVTEAVQARTIFVAGSRDDMMRAAYEALKRSDVLVPARFQDDARLVSVTDIPNRVTDSFHGDVAVLTEQLQQAGFQHVLARELDAERFEASVARVFVPGLEPYNFQWVANGPRAREFDAAQFADCA
jgi:ribosomal protein S12 methylthiotransferase accessory factor